jgi:hypothetical protein
VSAFEYLSVFISIILGLAVVHLLGGVSLIIDQRVRARLDAIHLLWVLNMFTLITWVWWGNWQLNDVVAFSSLHYVAMVLFSVVVYLMCGLLFPVRGREVEDFQEQFEMNRSRFFYLGLALAVAAALKGHVDRQVLAEPDTGGARHRPGRRGGALRGGRQHEAARVSWTVGGRLSAPPAAPDLYRVARSQRRSTASQRPRFSRLARDEAT